MRIYPINYIVKEYHVANIFDHDSGVSSLRV